MGSDCDARELFTPAALSSTGPKKYLHRPERVSATPVVNNSAHSGTRTGSIVTSEYRVKAAKLGAAAKQTADPTRRAQLESLEHAYLRLAVQADKNAETDIVYETPPTRRAQPAVQQQQQRQPKKNS